MADRASAGSTRYEILAALEARRVTYIVIGAFARVIHGTGELTDGLDVTTSMREENLSGFRRCSTTSTPGAAATARCSTSSS